MLWTASLTRDGYGSFGMDGKTRRAHKLSYEHFIGKVPDGLELDHLCRTRNCVNPEHLEPVSHKKNMERSKGFGTFGSYNRNKTHCKNGHELSGDNVYAHKGVRRQCRICKNVAWMRFYYRQKIEG
jgi:hypothetical protein